MTRVLTRLRLLPRPSHGAQQVVRTQLHIDPQPRAARSWADAFGNMVVEVEHPHLPTHLEVTAECCFAVAEVADPRAGELPVDIQGARRWFLPPTRLVDRTPELEAVATELRRCHADDAELAWAAMRHVYREMRYLSGSTGVETAASAAFAQRTGVCQDFAHVLLALCRAAGLPARYVSGHLEGEGQMHAWVEALVASSDDALPAWHPLDPTHDREAAGGYVTIAVGRDYADVSPISGRCYGHAPGRLSAQQETRRTARAAGAPRA